MLASVRKSGVVAFLLAAFLGIIGVAVLVIGVHDLSISGTSAGLTSLNVVLLVIGLAQVAAALHLAELGFAARRREPGTESAPCKQRVLVALGLTALLGAYVFISAMGTPSQQRPVVIAVALLIIAGSVLGVVALRDDARLELPRLQTALLVTVAGTLIGLGQFWYQNEYTPAHLGRAVALSANLRLAGREGPYDVVDATLGWEDVGGRNVAVIGSAYSLTGSPIYSCVRTATAAKLRNDFSGFLPDPQRSRWMNAVNEGMPTVIAAGRFVADGDQLQAGVQATRGLVFFVPHNAYQLLRLRAQLYAISASALAAAGALPTFIDPKHPIPGESDQFGYWQLNGGSWLRALLYGRRQWLAIHYELATQPSSPNARPDLRVTARFLEPTWSESPPSDSQIESAFVSTVTTQDPATHRPVVSKVEKPVPEDESEPFADSELAIGAPRVATPQELRNAACMNTTAK
jgi:hypothetical protein